MLVVRNNTRWVSSRYRIPCAPTTAPGISELNALGVKGMILTGDNPRQQRQSPGTWGWI
ncbi:hypothetical protein ACNKHM_14280 [Shigella sonnei]